MTETIIQKITRRTLKVPHKYSLAGVPLPTNLTQRNILVTGGMGSGKTVAIFELCDQVAAAGKTMVVYDKLTDFARHYYRDGHDVIFNPFDARFPGWSVLNEIGHVGDCDWLAECLLPANENAGGAGDYINSNARTVFSSILQRLLTEGKRGNDDLCRAVFETSPQELYELLKDTPAESVLAPENKGTNGALTTLQNSLQVLRYVPAGDFSLKKFIHEGGDRRLFITSKEDFHPILQPLIATVVSFLYTTVTAGEEVAYDKYWFVLDDLASIGKLPVFATALPEAHKFGAVSVVSVQDLEQFDAIFGKDTSSPAVRNWPNQLVLRVKEAETAERYSQLIGVSLNKEQRAVLAREIMVLPDCTGFVAAAGNFNTAQVSYAPKPRAVNHGAQGWLPRADLKLDTTLPQL